jgi:hypothetical protein
VGRQAPTLLFFIDCSRIPARRRCLPARCIDSNGPIAVREPPRLRMLQLPRLVGADRRRVSPTPTQNLYEFEMDSNLNLWNHLNFSVYNRNQFEFRNYNWIYEPIFLTWI